MASAQAGGTTLDSGLAQCIQSPNWSAPKRTKSSSRARKPGSVRSMTCQSRTVIKRERP